MSYIASETYIEAAGKRYRLAKFDRLALQQFLDWADEKIPHPLKSIAPFLKDLPTDIANQLVNEAIQKTRVRKNIDDPEVKALLESPEGAVKVFCLLLQRYQPELTTDQAEAVFDAAVAEHGENYLNQKIGEASGVIPTDEAKAKESVLAEAGLVAKKKK